MAHIITVEHLTKRYRKAAVPCNDPSVPKYSADRRASPCGHEIFIGGDKMTTWTSGSENSRLACLSTSSALPAVR